MNITQFKPGDLITRSEPMSFVGPDSMSFFSHQTGKQDGSFIGSQLKLVGIESGTIFLLDIEDEEIIKLEAFRWSEGWDYFPVSLFEVAKKWLEELKKK